MGDAKALWTQDTYKGQRQQLRGGLRTTNIRKIMISNLNFRVTSKNLRDIFNKFGPLKNATVHYDRFGRSLGTADVVFHVKNIITCL